ncbi:MAG: dihydrofolate reductase family protein [Deinococcales bacterium]
MRKVAAGLFITMDGVVEEPSHWQETFDEDMGEAMTKMLADTDTIVLGRVTYQYWEPYWTSDKVPESDQGFADFINHSPKYVASRKLKEVPWGNFNNATLIGQDLAKELGAVKATEGKNISVMGSPTLVNSLIQENLLDELTLIIHNVAAYGGAHLFNQGQLKRFKLIEAKATRSGVIIASYQPRMV